MPDPLFQFDHLSAWDGVVHGITTRKRENGGNFNLSFNLGDDRRTQKNREHLMKLLGGRLMTLVDANQVHGDKIVVIRREDEIPSVQDLDGVDALITNQSGVGVMVKTADCQPILLFAPDRKVIAAVHSGWRGSLKNIVGKVVLRMVRDFEVDAAQLIVGVGPSMGPCCGEFSDPERELNEAALRHRVVEGISTECGRSEGCCGRINNIPHEEVTDRQKNFIDFWALTKEQLTSEGVREENIEFSRSCTVCEMDRWFSYRGDAVDSGRFGSVIGLVSD